MQDRRLQILLGEVGDSCAKLATGWLLRERLLTSWFLGIVGQVANYDVVSHNGRENPAPRSWILSDFWMRHFLDTGAA